MVEQYVSWIEKKHMNKQQLIVKECIKNRVPSVDMYTKLDALVLTEEFAILNDSTFVKPNKYHR